MILSTKTVVTLSPRPQLPLLTVVGLVRDHPQQEGEPRVDTKVRDLAVVAHLPANVYQGLLVGHQLQVVGLEHDSGNHQNRAVTTLSINKLPQGLCKGT